MDGLSRAACWKLPRPHDLAKVALFTLQRARLIVVQNTINLDVLEHLAEGTEAAKTRKKDIASKVDGDPKLTGKKSILQRPIR
jgi:hypothetical protein